MYNATVKLNSSFFFSLELSKIGVTLVPPHCLYVQCFILYLFRNTKLIKTANHCWRTLLTS